MRPQPNAVSPNGSENDGLASPVSKASRARAT
jgi:hypothetical protein